MRNNDKREVQANINEIKSQLKFLELVKSEDKRNNINNFLEQIEVVATPKERNELYSTIIASITWDRNTDGEANIVMWRIFDSEKCCRLNHRDAW